MQLNYKVYGSGQPLVILHGLFGMLDNLQLLARKLEQAGYMVYLVDQRDHGKSPHTEVFNYEVLAEDLNQFLEDNWLHQVILIGHSMGGKTAMQFVSHYTTDIRKLIVVDIAPKAYPRGHESVFDALLSIDLAGLSSRNDAEEMLMSKLNDIGTVQFLMKNLSRKKEGGFEWKMNLPLLHQSYPNILSEITTDHPVGLDVLFIQGEHSGYILDSDKEDILKKFPDAKFELIPDAGHWVHADAPDALYQSVIRFIET
jgi:esterase